jgi:hypothetical protein
LYADAEDAEIETGNGLGERWPTGHKKNFAQGLQKLRMGI